MTNQRRRSDPPAGVDPHVAAAEAKAELRLALAQLRHALDRAEKVLDAEQDEHPRG